MKKLIPLLLFALLFCSCKHEIKNWIAVSVQTDDITTYHCVVYPDKTVIWIDTNLGTELSFDYFLLPLSDIAINIIDIYSTNTDVLTIESVDYENRIITAKAVNIGDSKIIIKTKSHSNCSTPTIYVN